MITGVQPLDTSVGSIRIRCYLDDNVSERKYLFLPWSFDTEERDFLLNKLSSNAVFVDIGANVGIYSLWACQCLSSGGKVIALEPNPKIYGRLVFNLGLFRETGRNCPEIIPHQVAIGDREEKIFLNLDVTNLGGSSIVYHSESPEKIEVNSRLLTSILEESGVNAIDILKIDIEGAEDIALTPFLESADDTLLPAWIIIENSEHLWKSDLISKFKQRGYALDFKTRMNSVYRKTRS